MLQARPGRSGKQQLEHNPPNLEPRRALYSSYLIAKERIPKFCQDLSFNLVMCDDLDLLIEVGKFLDGREKRSLSA